MTNTDHHKERDAAPGERTLDGDRVLRNWYNVIGTMRSLRVLYLHESPLRVGYWVSRDSLFRSIINQISSPRQQVSPAESAFLYHRVQWVSFEATAEAAAAVMVVEWSGAEGHEDEDEEHTRPSDSR